MYYYPFVTFVLVYWAALTLIFIWGPNFDTFLQGVITNLKDDTYSILSMKHDSLSASVNENLSDVELNIMDEVEFTLTTVSELQMIFALPFDLPLRLLRMLSAENNISSR